jgi:mRNA-degrading endonuclease toxin of MazEF toxin-antitoxin module
VDAVQLRAVSLERFERKLGAVTSDQMEEVVTAIAAVVEYA